MIYISESAMLFNYFDIWIKHHEIHASIYHARLFFCIDLIISMHDKYLMNFITFMFPLI